MNAQAAIDHRSLSDQIFAHIKRLILTGELKGGERIPEEPIGRQFGVSRTPMREALRRLEHYGLVRIKPRSYAEVVSMAPEEVDRLAEVRAAIEELSARLFAVRATAADCDTVARAARLCSDALAGRDMAGAFERDSEFHLAIAERCGNAYVHDIVRRLDARVQLARLVRCGTYEHVCAAVAQHDQLVAAFRRNAAEEAAGLMREHVMLMAPAGEGAA